MSLFAPKLPADLWKEERLRVERSNPHLRLVDKRPQSDHFKWHRVEDLIAQVKS